jgi:hypothetical protein
MAGASHHPCIVSADGLRRSLTPHFGLVPSLPSPHHELPPKDQQIMQSCSTDWEDTFQYLSREILAPETIAADPQQVPTPPVCFGPHPRSFATALTLLWSAPLQASDTLSPYPKENVTVVSVSTTFYPGADLGQSHPPDLTLHSSDSVFFYVHTTALLQFSTNSFNSTISPYPVSPISEDGSRPAIILPEDSHVLNIVLHLLYMIPCSHFCPPIDIVFKAVNALKRYGVSIKSLATPDTCLYNLILSRAPLHPIEFYAISAEHDLYDLAVAISPHLMSFNLSTLTDEIVTQMGPTYLKRLFFFHLGRNEALKRLLFAPPTLHGPTPQCDFTEQKKLTRAWALAAAYLAWDARPGLSCHISSKWIIIHSCSLSLIRSLHQRNQFSPRLIARPSQLSVVSEQLKATDETNHRRMVERKGQLSFILLSRSLTFSAFRGRSDQTPSPYTRYNKRHKPERTICSR